MQKFDLLPPVNSGFQQIMKVASGRLIKIITHPLLTIALLVSVTAENVFAQVPSISYGVAKNYLVNAAITPLSPTNNGGAVAAPGYSSSPVNIFSGTSYSVSFVRDASNNIYTFDFSVSNNHKLVKLSPTGTNPVELLTFLGRPEDIAIDPSGNVFALDGATIYKITPAGAVSTFQTVSSASGIGIDGAGNVYVARYSGSTTSILEFPADGGSSISIGSGLGYMTDVAVDAAGNVYVCNDNDASIKKFPADGSSMITIASGFTSFSTADLSQIIVDPAGNIFFSERNGSKVSEIPAGSTTPVAIGSGFFAPEGLMLDATGNLFVIDNGTLKKFKPIGGYYVSPALPAGLSIDQTTGTISGTPTVLSDATNYTITASNASGSNSVTLSIGVLASVSTDANLTGLTISPGSFSPAFDKATFLYTMDVPYSTTSITLTPTLEDPNATVQIYAHFVTSGTPSLDIPLAPGTNTASVLVFAQDGTTKNVYRVAVTRAAGSTVADLSNLTTSANSFTPAFDVNTTSYNASVPNDSLTTTITPTVADASAIIKVRVNAGSYKLISSGSTSDPLALNAGDNTIDVQVTAQDGTTTKTYTITVNRALATNNVLTTLKYYPGISQTQVSGPDYKDFSATVANTFTSITATPTTQAATATVKINGTTVASGATSTPIALNVGLNTITTVVTAQDGTTKTYKLTIRRQSSALLTDLSYSPPIVQTQVTGPNYKDFTATVPNKYSYILVTPTAADAGATIKVNGTIVPSGVRSAQIPLVAGPNTINTVVTAADGLSSKTYSLVVTRLPSSLLTTLKYYPQLAQTLVSGSNYADYTATVANTYTTVKVTPTAQGAGATIKVNGTTVASGSDSGPISLDVGSNLITTVVTASDGSSTTTYTLTITRQPVPPVAVVMQYQPQESPITNTAIVVHQNVSPNGDGNSDALVIEGIAAHPDNKLQIMSRSGALVYEAKGYDNATKVFDGHSSTNGKLQQPGTYFYSLEYKDGNETKHKTGFIVLKY